MRKGKIKGKGKIWKIKESKEHEITAHTCYIYRHLLISGLNYLSLLALS
jgi:hypothetical protein